MKSGIYQIICRTTGERYIGSSTNIIKRWGEHRLALRKNKHHSIHLQKEWNKYGEGEFTFAFILSCLPSELIQFEQDWLDAVEPEYNVCKTAGSRAGLPHTDEAKARMSAAKIGNQYCVGRKYSEETLSKMSAAHAGVPNPRRNTGKGYSWVADKKLWRAQWVDPSGKRIVKRFKHEERAIAWLAERKTP